MGGGRVISMNYVNVYKIKMPVVHLIVRKEAIPAPKPSAVELRLLS